MAARLEAGTRCLEAGTRRLVFYALDGEGGLRPFEWPRAAVEAAVKAARARVAYLRANPPRRGRPKRAARS